MTELTEVLKTFDKLDKTLTQTRACLMDAKEVPVEGEMRLPDPQSIRDFYADYIMFKIGKMSVESDSLTIRTASQSLKISMLGILELLSDKFKVPVVCVPEQKLTTKPPFVADIDALVKNKMDWIKAEFNRILALDDPRINRLCQDYFRVQSYPLIVRLNYLEWERGFISYHIKQTETRLEDKKSLELREIRKQYTDRIDKEKSSLNMRISQMQNELQRMRTVNNRLDGLFQSAQTENTTLKQEIESLHAKSKGNEEGVTRYSEENLALKAEVEILKNRLNKYESSEWRPDFASTNANPVFCNVKYNTIIKFPCSMGEFKQEYSLKSSDGQNRIYTNKTGKEFTLPDTLALKLPSMIQEQQPTGASKDESQHELIVGGKQIHLTGGAKAVYDFLLNSDEPQSTGQIVEGTGIAQSTISARHIKTLKERGLVQINGLKKYSVID
jgi:hypothetical protein